MVIIPIPTARVLHRLVVCLVFGCTLTAARAQTAFHYQGRLTAAGQPADGLYDCVFALYPVPEGGDPVGPILTNSAVTVAAGLLETDLDFGAEVLDGRSLWLAIAIRPPSSEEPYVPLAPRQRLSPTPYALHALDAARAAEAEIASAVAPGSVTAREIAPGAITADRLADQQVVRSLSGLQDHIALSAGDNILIAAGANTLTISADTDWHLSGNSNTIAGQHFVGTLDDQPLELRVQGHRALRLEPTDFPALVNVIGGSSSNFVRAGITGATIAGGGAVYPDGGGEFPNAIHAHFSVIGGGRANYIGTNASNATISGGHSNVVSLTAFEAVIGGGKENLIEENAFRAVIGGGYLHQILPGAYGAVIDGGISNTVAAYFSVVGGGSRNTIQTNARYATISGGGDNRIAVNSFSGTIGGGGENQILEDSQRSTIAGGKLNVIGPAAPHSSIGGGLSNRIDAQTEYGTIPGGCSNTVSAELSLAAGYRAQALHPGSFVWADGTDQDFVTARADEFAVRAAGGVRFVTATDVSGEPAAGVVVEPGSGSWSSLSDRAAKRDFLEVEPQTILERLTELPIRTWAYKGQPRHVRHIGPTAQEFQAAFDLGEDSRHISMVDADGVALAAIQGLHTLLEEKARRIAALETQNAQLEKRLETLEQRLGFGANLPAPLPPGAGQP